MYKKLVANTHDRPPCTHNLPVAHLALVPTFRLKTLIVPLPGLVARPVIMIVTKRSVKNLGTTLKTFAVLATFASSYLRLIMNLETIFVIVFRQPKCP